MDEEEKHEGDSPRVSDTHKWSGTSVCMCRTHHAMGVSATQAHCRTVSTCRMKYNIPANPSLRFELPEGADSLRQERATLMASGQAVLGS